MSKVAIIGSGYVGLPLAIAFSKKLKVTCYDVDKKRVDNLKRNIDENNQHSVRELKSKNLNFSNNKNDIRDHNYYIITVPTPISNHNHPDLSYLEEATINVAQYLKKGAVVVYESTTYPGCTNEFCIPLLEKYSQLKYDKDFYVAFSPERINPGDKINTINSITKIVGSDNIKITNKVEKLYKIACKKICKVNSIKIAESAKVIENIQRDVNIALVNELSVLFGKLNIPTDEVLKAAATKWNFHYYRPGLVGGHCISVDPYYLSHKAEEKNYFPQLILAGRRINENMGRYVATQTVKQLTQNNINLSKAKVGIFGFAFKENISDIRNTKIIQIIEELKNWGVKIDVFDPQVYRDEVKQKYNLDIKNLKNIKKFKFDCIILAVTHKEFLKPLSFYNKLYKKKSKKILIDIKNNFSESVLKKNKYHFFQL